MTDCPLGFSDAEHGDGSRPRGHAIHDEAIRVLRRDVETWRTRAVVFAGIALGFALFTVALFILKWRVG